MESYLADQNPTIQTFKNIWNGTYIFHAIILAIIFSVTSFFLGSGVWGVLIYTLLFTAFDCLGWRIIIIPFIETTKRIIEYYNTKIINCELLDSSDSQKADFKSLCLMSQAEHLKSLYNAKAAYRTMQTMFQWILLIPVYLIFGYWSALGCLVVWWFGFDDLLYYIINKESIKETKRFEWLESWTVHLIHGKAVDLKLFVGFSIIGALLGAYLGSKDKNKKNLT